MRVPAPTFHGGSRSVWDQNLVQRIDRGQPSLETQTLRMDDWVKHSWGYERTHVEQSNLDFCKAVTSLLATYPPELCPSSSSMIPCPIDHQQALSPISSTKQYKPAASACSTAQERWRAVLHLLDGFFSVEKGRVPPHLKDSLRAKECLASQGDRTCCFNPSEMGHIHRTPKRRNTIDKYP